MNLLEYFQRNLDDSNKALAIQLLNKPWNTDLHGLSKHVPKALYDQFAALRQDVLIRLDRIDNEPQPIVSIAVRGVAVGQQSSHIDDQNRIAVGNDRLWVDQIWTQIVEDIEESDRASSLLDEADRAAFVLLYTIAHACFFILVKVHDLSEHDRRGFALVANPGAADAHRLYWFAHYLSSQSMLADHLVIHNLLESVCKDFRSMHLVFHASTNALAICREYFTDKFLSLHPDYVYLMNAKDRAAIDAMTDRLGLIVYIYLCSVRQQLDAGEVKGSWRFDRLLAVEISTEDLRRARFNNSAISELVDECMRQPIGDRFLVDVGGGRLQMGDISLKYAMQTHCHVSLSRMNFRGDWFEKDYIANYIRERIPVNRYRVFSGINDKLEKYDADVIIEDMRTGALYFCQVKHRTTTLLAHLRDELKEYMDNSQIVHGLTQLKNLRSLIGSAGVLMRVKQKTGHRKLTATSLAACARYLLIHNIENLDFCTSEGIAMYEWNTLRNLLKNTLNTVTKGGITSVSSVEGDINLDDPHQVMEAFCRRIETTLPAGQATPSMHWNSMGTSRLVFQIKRSLYVKGFPLVSFNPFGFSLPVI
jgi:hypothetical protein